MNYHNMTQKSLFESYMSPAPIMSRCFSSKANVFAPHLPGNSLYSANGYLGNMRHFNKNAHFGPGHLKMPPLEHRSEFCDPLVKIVGGFVGSKSQAGTTNHRGRELYLWDIIVDKIMETMENQEAKHEQRKMVDPGKRNGRIHKIESITMIGVGHYESESGSNNYHYKDWHRPYKSEVKRSNGDFPMMQNIVSESLNSWRLPNDKTERTNDSPTVEPCPDTLKVHDSSSRAPLNLSPQTPLEKRHSSPISICATKSPISVTSDDSFCSSPPKHILRPEAAEFTPRIPRRTRLSTESESEDSLPTDSISSSCESRHSSDTFLQPKIQRTLSECSVDSDDSFIVFESAEDDPMIVSEDSDDEDSGSDEDLDEIDNLILIPHNVEFSQPQAVPSRLEEANRKWAESYCGVHSEDSVKKVRFAEGKDLVKVKHLVAWNFAHRAARVGPWEMYHRDSERFKSRINALSAVLSPVLAKHHREKIYTERFQT